MSTGTLPPASAPISGDDEMKKTRISFLVLVFALLATACSRDPQPPVANDIPQSAATGQAALAVPEPYAAKIAEDILRRGGNAVDAAIATGFAMAVTFIDAGNIGGGGFMLVHVDGESAFLDYREKAPLAAHRDMYLDESGAYIPESSLVGGQAAAVPGTVAGFWAAHQRYGSLPWRDLVMPAVELAENGFLPAKNPGR